MKLTVEQEVALFQGARTLLAAGWIKGRYCGVKRFSPDDYENTDSGAWSIKSLIEADCFCSLGSIRRAAVDLGLVQKLDPASGFLPIEVRATELFNETKPEDERVFDSRSDVASWNDHDDRTEAEVLGRFDQIIAHLAAKG